MNADFFLACVSVEHVPIQWVALNVNVHLDLNWKLTRGPAVVFIFNCKSNSTFQKNKYFIKISTNAVWENIIVVKEYARIHTGVINVYVQTAIL
jgi:hypothetical protein